MTIQILNRIDDLAWWVGQRHAGFIRELSGMRESHLQFGTQSGSQGYLRTADAATSILTLDIIDRTTREGREIAQAAGDAFSLSPSEPNVEPEVTAMKSALTAAALRDRATFAACLRNDALLYTMALGRTGQPSLAMNAVRTSWGGARAFESHSLDTMGRRYKGTPYMVNTARMHLLAFYAVGYFSAGAKSGAQSFKALRGSSVARGALVDFPAWATENLHPNSEWTLEAPE
jgi:hypothetical protein